MSTRSAPKVPAPPGLHADGGRLWASVVDTWDLAEHELVRLAEACFLKDRLNDLRGVLAAEGLSFVGPSGPRLHPAVAELRASEVALDRLLSGLGIPDAEDGAPVAPARRRHRRLTR